MIDMDHPSRQNPVFRSRLLWGISDVPLKNWAYTDDFPYTPPSPSSNSGTHRIVLFAFKVNNLVFVTKLNKHIRYPTNLQHIRTAFNVKLFMDMNGMELAGGNFFLTESID